MGPLRDTQVQLLTVRKLLPRFPQLGPFSTVLLMRELRCMEQIAERLGRVRMVVIRAEVIGGVRSLDQLLRVPETRAAANAALRGAVASAFARVAARHKQLTLANHGTIHRMRVAFKKFRYAHEVLSRDASIRKRMNAFQTKMGELHDTEVILSSLRSFVRRYPSSRAMLDVRRHLGGQLGGQTKTFVRSVGEYRRYYHE
jgi:CHAD domain-containing protein